jgi:hypothetical protein
VDRQASEEDSVSDRTPFKQFVDRLDAISGDDPESAHGQADDVLLECVPAEVREAYERVAARCSWWAAA